MRYRVDNVPNVGMGAFMPGLVLNGVSYGAGLRRIVGYPGNREVPVDHDENLSQLGHDPKTQPSNVAPDVILPAVYVPLVDNMGPWAPRGAAAVAGPPNDSVLPVPAVQPTAIPLPAAKPAPRIGGRTPIPWPRTVVSYPGSST